MTEEMSTYLDLLRKEHSDFIQKWAGGLNTPELDEYLSHLTEEEKDALFILLLIKLTRGENYDQKDNKKGF